MPKKVKAGPYINTARARKTPGKTVKVGGTVVIKGKPGQKPLTHKKGALHAQLDVPQGKPIPAAKKRGALAQGRKTAAKKRK